jgi:hypothetical protein
MIRLLLILLVLGNLAAFGLASGLVETWWPAGREPARVAALVAPERLVGLPAGAARTSTGAGAAGAAGGVGAPGGSGASAGAGPAAGAPVGSPEAASGAAGAAGAAGAPGATGATGATDAASAGVAGSATLLAGAGAVTSPTASPASAAAVGAALSVKALCLEAGPLDKARAERVRQWAQGLRPGLQASLERRPETPSYMVYLPSASDADAQRLLARLQEKRVADTYVIREGSLRNAISLGYFTAQDRASTRLKEVTDLGFTGARIGPGPTRPERTMARLTRAPAATEAAWTEARARLQELAGIDPVACATP